MAVAPKAAPPNRPADRQAAQGRPVTDSAQCYGQAALRLLENGYEPLPILPLSKKPVLRRWSTISIDVASVEQWARQYAGAGVGLRTGTLVGIDVDLIDPDLAHHVAQLVRDRLGATLVRVGQWPKRLLLYRTDAPFAKMSLPGIEVLASGQQLVAFGIHPGTNQPYYWLDDTPLDVPLDALPLVDRRMCEDLLGEVAALLPPARVRKAQAPQTPGAPCLGPVRNEQRLVIDGRDGWLSSIAFHVVHDFLAADRLLDPIRPRSGLPGSASPQPPTFSALAAAAGARMGRPMPCGRWRTSCGCWPKAGCLPGTAPRSRPPTSRRSSR